MLSLALLFLAADIHWPAYGNDPGGARHSPATQITPQNISTLQTAWSYQAKGLHRPKNGRTSALETTPLYVEGKLFVSNPLGRVAALDPATGKELWSFDPKIPRDAGYGDFTNRGVSWHKSGRILAVSVDARLFSLDSRTGKMLWEVDLRKGLRIAPDRFSDYEQTSPPCVIGNIVVVGSAVADNGSTRMPSGEVRGFDVKTGRLLWTWDPIPQSQTGGGNAWSIITADEKRGIVYVPTGSASPDYYGGKRKAPNHANSIVALEAKTGRMLWSFQTVHHDLWDYDVASPPLLYRANGQDAVAVGSKTGHLFLLNRITGKPIFGVEERSVPQSDAEGEESSPTQPFPVKPPSLSPHRVEFIDECKDLMGKYRDEGIFTPPSEHGSIAIPGNIGGLHWGGMAYDPKQHLLIAPANHFAALVQLIRRENYSAARTADKFGMEFAPQAGTPYGMARRFLLTEDRQPCVKGPHGTLSAVDTRTGEIRWQVPLGTSINLGGPITTASDLTFIGASLDGYFRAFETSTGKERWKTKLPASARSTPMTYVHQGKQYVVISAGGHDERFGPLGDEIIAFTLSQK